MKYDPIKKILGDVVRDHLFLRRTFYKLLGLIFLREWLVKRELRRVFEQHPIKRVLDAGSGFGQYSYYCATKFPRSFISAVDVKEDQIADCKQFFTNAGLSNVSFAVQDLTQLAHVNEFDLIMSVEVMEHIPDDEAVFRNFARALKPGGIVLISTPAKGLTAEGTELQKEDSFIEEHVRFGYTPEEITGKLAAAGLVVSRLGFTYGRWGSYAWILTLKTPLLLLNASKVFFAVLPFYYVVTFPIALVFMVLEYVSFPQRGGGGLLVVARKPPTEEPRVGR